MIVAGIGLIFGVINLLAGNTFSILALIIDIVVIATMKRKSVRAWLNDETV